MAFLDELQKNITDFSTSAVKKSEEILNLQKARARVTSVSGDLKSAYAELGKMYYEKYSREDQPEELTDLCLKITDCRAALSEARENLDSLRKK